MQIYGITGYKQSGKDTFASLINFNKTFYVTHFADPLKKLLIKVFKLSQDIFHDNDKKEQIFDNPINIDLYLPRLCNETGLNIQPANKVASSPRQLMQFVGTNYIRATNKDYWIHRLIADIHGHKKVLVPDVRFLDEAEALRCVGGRIIKVSRFDHKQTDLHESEREIDKIDPELLVMTRTNHFTLPECTAKLIAANKFNAAMKYDYRLASKAIGLYNLGFIKESYKLFGTNTKNCEVLYRILEYYDIPRQRQSKNKNQHVIIDDKLSKLCNKCGLTKELKNYNKSTRSWDGFHTLCRDCAKEWHHVKYVKEQNEFSLEKLYEKCKRTSKYRGINFELTLDDLQSKYFSQNKLCKYSGRELSFLSGDNKITIDRVDSNKGYTADNVALCCYTVNLMKRDIPLKEFISLVQEIYKHTAY